MDLSIGGGVKSSRSKGLQDFVMRHPKDSMSLRGAESSALSDVENFDDKPVNSASKKFEQVSNNVNLKTVEKTAGLPRSQGYLLPRNDMMKKVAFTLAEVLITLGIIGVVAAMTLPALITNYKEKQTVSQLKKFYSTLSQAWLMMENEYGSMDEWGMSNTNTGQTDPETGERILDPSAQLLIAERLKPYLKIGRECVAGEICYNRKTSDLFTETSFTEPKPLSEDSAKSQFFLSDGTYVNIGYYSKGLNKVDISCSLQGRNVVLGKNRFYFQGMKNRVVPEGLPDFVNLKPFDNNCNAQSGRGCTAWVIYKGNMDYLHCRDKLSWTGKSSCKD